MGGLFGGGGGGGAGAGTSGTPSNVQAQVYQPQDQPAMDVAYQTLLSSLYNPALGSMQAMGNVPPAQQIYPTAQQIGGQASGFDPSTGAYGTYGPTALGTALGGLNQWAQFLPGYESAVGANLAGGQTALSQVMQNAFNNPQAAALTQAIVNNPYFAQQMAGAQQGADIGAAATMGLPQTMAAIQGIAGGLPGAGQAAAGVTGQQAGLTSGLAQNLAGAVPGLSAQAGAYQPYLNQLLAGGTIPTSQALAAQGTGLPAGFNQQLAQTYAPLQAASNAILQTGFDPQSALYNRTVQRLADQANAVNAMTGVGTSPYGASTTGNVLGNFNIDWANQQLARQTQAAGAAGQLAGMLPGFQGQALSNLAGAQNLLNQPASQALALQQAGLGVTGAQANILNALTQGAGGLAGTTGTLSGQALNQLLSGAGGAANLYGQALGLGGQGANLAAQAAGMPAQTYQQQQTAGLQALGNLLGLNVQGIQGLQGISGITGQAGQQGLAGIQGLTQLGAAPAQLATQQQQNALNALTQQLNLGQAQFALPQAVMNELQSYLQLGQSASQLSGQLGQLGFGQQQQNLANLGGLIGMGSNALFGSPGLGLTGGTGLLGSGTTGLLGGGGLGGALGGLIGSSPTTLAAGTGFQGGLGGLDLGIPGIDITGSTTGSGLLGTLGKAAATA